MQAKPKKRNHDHLPVVLVIPTLGSRTTIYSTLSSLSTRVSFFDQLVISVNGTSAERVGDILTALELYQHCEVHLLCTNKVLSAIRHIIFIRRHLQAAFGKKALLYFLADDDLVAPESNLQVYLEACQCAASSKVGMGNLHSFVDEPSKAEIENQHINPGETISSLEFLHRNLQGHLWTNISSMIVPCNVFLDCSLFMGLLGSAGRRTEYIWATHHSIKTLVCPSSPSALIRQHPAQEGRTLSYESYLQDELIYIIWVWLNQPAARPWSAIRHNYGFTFIRFKGLFKELLTLRLRRNPLIRTSTEKIKKTKKLLWR